MFIKKKLLPMLLTIVMLFSALPLQAFAADGVGFVEMQVDTNVANVDVASYENYVSLVTSNVKFLTDYDCEGVYAYCVTDGGDKVTKFEAGKEYKLMIYLIEEDGYALPSSSGTDTVECTVNGVTQSVSTKAYTKNGANFDYLEVVYNIVVAQPQKIESAKIGLETNLDGVSVSDYNNYVSIKTTGIGFEKQYTYANNMDSVIALDKETQTEVTEFEHGKVYDLSIYLGTVGPNAFAEAGAEFSGEINGETFEFTVYEDTVLGETVKYVLINYELVVTKPITEIDLTVKADIAGLNIDKYSDFITINTTGLTFDDDTSLPIYVTETETGSEVEEFARGKEYACDLYLVPTREYTLPAEGLTVPCTVNGNAATATVESSAYDGKIYYYFTVCFEITAIESVAAVDLDYSGYEFGANITDFKLKSKTDGVNVNIVLISDEKETFLTSGTFEYGKTYIVHFGIESSAEYTLKNLTADKVRINNVPAEYFEYDTSYSSAYLALPVLTEPHEHKYDGYSNDDKEHWKECTDKDCPDKDGSIIGKGEHKDGIASCTEQAVCGICGVKYGDLLEHTPTTILTPATDKEDGSSKEQCKNCPKVISETVINKIANIEISNATFIYNGEEQKPTVSVVDSAEKQLKEGDDYTVVYPEDTKSVGSHTITISFKGNYAGEAIQSYVINPKSTKLSKLKGAKKKITVKWKKCTKETTGYEIQYSTKKNFKGAKVVSIAKNKTKSKVIKKLKSKKKYFVRIRTYKKVDAVYYYSSWSSKKSVKTK